jgi:tetratricopeptide (TPR) repeat protein
MLYLKYLDGVEYNLALCYFFTKNYDKSIEILNKIKNIETMKNNPYLFYRLATCYIEKELLRHKTNFKMNNENDIVCKTIFNDNNDEPAFKKRFLLVNQSPTPSIINPPNEQNNDKGEIKEENTIDTLNLTEAINALKECILIIKGYSSYNAQIYNTLKPLMNNQLIDLKPLFNENKEKNFTDDSTQYNDIYELAYLNLIFCLLRTENYAECIEVIEEFRENNANLNKYKFILDNYSIEAYLKLGEFDKALNILSKENFSYENIDAKGAFFSNSNHQIYNEVTYRLALYINLIKINILNNNTQDAEKYIHSILSLLNYPTEKELPPYVINIIIFYFLSIGKNEQAVQVIKYRRIPKFYNN